MELTQRGLESQRLGWAGGLPSVMSRAFLCWFLIETGQFDDARKQFEAGCALADAAKQLYSQVLIHAGDALHHANDEFLALSGYGTLDEIEAAGGLGALFAASDEDHLEGSDRQMRLTRRDGSDVPVDRPVVRRAYVLEDPLSQPPVAPEPPGAGPADPAQ